MGGIYDNMSDNDTYTIRTYATNNRHELEKARVLSKGDFAGSIFVGNGRITFASEAAEEAMSEITGRIPMK